MKPLKEAIDIAVKGEFPSGSSEIDGHKFYIRSVKNKNQLSISKLKTRNNREWQINRIASSD